MQQTTSDVPMSKKKTLLKDSQSESEDETTDDEASANEKNQTKEKVREPAQIRFSSNLPVNLFIIIYLSFIT